MQKLYEIQIPIKSYCNTANFTHLGIAYGCLYIITAESIETIWPAKPTLFIIKPFTESFLNPVHYCRGVSGNMPGVAHLYKITRGRFPNNH